MRKHFCLQIMDTITMNNKYVYTQVERNLEGEENLSLLVCITVP